MAASRMIDQLLLRGSDDWVTAADVAWVAKSVGGATSDHEIQELALAAITEVVTRGLMQVGDVTDGGFFEWEETPDEALETVARAWRALGRSPDLGEVCWLANTPAGDARAQTVADERAP